MPCFQSPRRSQSATARNSRSIAPGSPSTHRPSWSDLPPRSNRCPGACGASGTNTCSKDRQSLFWPTRAMSLPTARRSGGRHRRRRHNRESCRARIPKVSPCPDPRQECRPTGHPVDNQTISSASALRAEGRTPHKHAAEFAENCPHPHRRLSRMPHTPGRRLRKPRELPALHSEV